MKNIYIVDEHQSSRYNGIGTYIRELIECLVDTEYSLTKLSFNAEIEEVEMHTDKSQTSILFPQFQSGNFTNNPETVTALLELHISDNRHNVFFINHSPCNELLRMLKDIFPLSKFIFVIHDMYWTTPLMGNIEMLSSSKDNILVDRVNKEKELIEIADYVICLNKDTYRVLIDVYGVRNKSKIFVISNGLSCSTTEIDKDSIRRELRLSETEPLALFVGRMTHAKGLKDLIDAFEIILQTIPNMRLVLVGNNDPLFSRIKIDNTLASRIIFTGHLSKDELQKWYSVSDIGIIPSYSEQCSFVAIEMMMNSMAIVYADSFGLRCMFNDGVDARIAKRGDRFVHNMADAVVELTMDSELKHKLQINSRAKYVEEYSLDAMRRNYLKILNIILSE